MLKNLSGLDGKPLSIGARRYAEDEQRISSQLKDTIRYAHTLKF
jgi:hypothetical protein